VIVSVPKSTARSLIWGITASGDVFSATSSGIVATAEFPPSLSAHRIKVGQQGQVWILARDRQTGELTLQLRNARTAQWRRVCRLSAIAAIAAGRNGVWLTSGGSLNLLDEEGVVRRSHRVPFPVRDVCESSDGSLWVVAGEPRLGGQPLQRLGPNAQQWSEFPAPIAAVQLSCAPDGTAWTTNSKGQVWRIHPEGPGNFMECTRHADCRGCLKSPSAENIEEVSVGADQQIWCRTSKIVAGGTLVARIFPERSQIRELPRVIGAVSIAAGVIGNP
jgi:streptogramin lyase